VPDVDRGHRREVILADDDAQPVIEGMQRVRIIRQYGHDGQHTNALTRSEGPCHDYEGVAMRSGRRTAAFSLAATGIVTAAIALSAPAGGSTARVLRVGTWKGIAGTYP